MQYMVANPGIMPGMESLTNGDIPKKKKMIAEVRPSPLLSLSSPSPRNFEADLSSLPRL